MMDEPRFLRLDLRQPLVYVEDRSLRLYDTGESGPLVQAAGDEALFLFELDASQGLSIEPDPDLFLGPLIFSGRPAEDGDQTGSRRELPAGMYLFAQRRLFVNRQDCISMAIEVQKDGLWERLQPEPKLYLRYLIEDGQRVSQVFRPCKTGK
jgi:hypothetical protein